MDEQSHDREVEVPDLPTTEIVRTGGVTITPGGGMTAAQLEEQLKVAEVFVEHQERMKLLALKATRNGDWVDMGGSPYLSGTGAEAMARTFGLSIQVADCEKSWSTDKEGQFYIYTYIGAISGYGRILEIDGFCSERDQFFSMAHGERKEPDEMDIKRKAYTNFIGNGIKRFLGMRNVTWEELEQVGITPSGKVEYKTKGGAKGKSRAAAKPAGNGAKRTPEQARERIFVILQALTSSKDKTVLADRLQKLTEFKGKEGDMIFKRSILELRGKWLFSTLDKAEEEMDAFVAHPDVEKEKGEPEEDARNEDEEAAGDIPL